MCQGSQYPSYKKSYAFRYRKCLLSIFFVALASSIPFCGILQAIARLLDVGSFQLITSHAQTPFLPRAQIHASLWHGNNSSRIAYALLCTENLWRYAYVLAHRIRNITRISHDLLILTPEHLPAHLIDLFGQLHAMILHVKLEPPPTVRPLETAFKVSWIKLHLFTLVS
jgi:hypothetical protein